jgi:hypothetical protein
MQVVTNISEEPAPPNSKQRSQSWDVDKLIYTWWRDQAGESRKLANQNQG